MKTDKSTWSILVVLGIVIVFSLPIPVLATNSFYGNGGVKLEIISKFNTTEIFVTEGGTDSRRLIYSAWRGAVRDNLVVLSPDEKYVALVEITEPEMPMSKLVLIDLETDKTVDLVLPRDGAMPTNPLWSPDSAKLAYVWFNPAQASVELWLADVPSGQQQRIVAGDMFWTNTVRITSGSMHLNKKQAMW